MNQITSLEKEDGKMTVHKGEIAKWATNYFQFLFKGGRVNDVAYYLLGIETTISHEENQSLEAEYTADEIFSALNEMSPTKVPNFDGFPIIFF